jgi:hypothetical protein
MTCHLKQRKNIVVNCSLQRSCRVLTISLRQNIYFSLCMLLIQGVEVQIHSVLTCAVAGGECYVKVLQVPIE